MENWSFEGWKKENRALVDSPSWEQVEGHLRKLENKSMSLRYLDSTLHISGHRTPDSFAYTDRINPAVFVPGYYTVDLQSLDNYQFLLSNELDLPEPEPVLHQDGSAYTDPGFIGSATALRVVKFFFETGKLDPEAIWEVPETK